MKQILRKTLLILLGGVMGTAGWGYEDLPTPVYELTFDNASNVSDFGGVQHGSGSLVASGDARFGKYYQNMPDADAASSSVNYLVIEPTTTGSTNAWTDLHTAVATSNAFTISFWVNAKIGNSNNIDGYWTPLFVACTETAGNIETWNFGPYLMAAGQFHWNCGGYADDQLDDATDTRDAIYNAWGNVDGWHHLAWVFTNMNAAAGEKFTITLFVDGVQKYSREITATGGPALNMLNTINRIVIGGRPNNVWEWKDNVFAYDDIALYSQSLTAQQIRQIVFSKKQEKYFTENKGDLTEFINGTFETNANGWTGGTTWWSPADWRTRSWRGTDLNGFYELGSTGTMTYTLPNMPAGTYKVVAAARGYDGGSITAQIAGTSGTALTCVGDQRGADDAIPEINTNGVEMPYSSLGGFTTDGWGHNWRWITATGILNEIGNLVININGVGTSWMAIDDVHLYYVSDAYSGHSPTTTYCMSANGISANTMINLNSGTRCVTCDLVYTNPNLIVRTTGKISTAAGQELNNNKYSSTQLNKLVLYDGYSYSDYTDSQSSLIIDNGATLYRNIPADQWCTLMVPFYPTNLDVMKVSSAADETTVSFVDAPTADMNNKPMIVKSTAGVTKITGVRNGTYGAGYGDGTSGTGATMVGTYTDIAAVANDNYILAHPATIVRDVLLKVNSAVGLKPFRAYFTIPATARTLDIDFDNETTGINMVNGEGLKVNGSDVYYNLQGQRVLYPTKGLYIVNGHKVIIK